MIAGWSRPLLVLVFVALFLLGAVILAVAELQHEQVPKEPEDSHAPGRRDWRVIGVPFLQHLASALIVAAVMGLTYEYFVHRHVLDDFEALIKRHEAATEATFNSYRSTTARDVLTLLGNIAANSPKIPTLYDPPRAAAEIVFATDHSFFETLVSTPSARKEAITVLEQWINTGSLHLRFLGSDFIGMLRLHELAPRLRELAAEDQKTWRAASPEERGCILNFWWAASRCEDPMYESLKTRLLEWDDPEVQRWILFVAKQMPNSDLASMVEEFVRSKRHRRRKEVLQAAVDAIDTLHNTGYSMRRVVYNNRKVFESAGLWEDACAAVAAVPAGTRRASMLGRVGRLLTLRRPRRGA